MFSAVAEQMGVDYQTAVKVSCGFGGGMYLGSVCGAVTGGIMAIGLKHGGAGMQANIQTAKMVREFADRFRARHKSINCSDLTGFDLSKIDFNRPEQLKAVADQKGFANCLGYVRDAAAIVSDVLKT